MKESKNIMLVGIGPHAKRIHLNYLKKNNIIPKLVIELESQEKTSREILDSFGFQQTEIWTIKDSDKDSETLSKEYEINLKEKIEIYHITHAIISTEPKAHNMYLTFCLKNNINVLSDKPITVVKDMTSLESIQKIKLQYQKLLNLYNQSTSSCRILCQRQYHRGYQFIRNLLKNIIEQYGIPITYIDIYHCDGKWEMPHDLNGENHPYKYGYGKLFHSGYHFIDLLAEFLKLNQLTEQGKFLKTAEMYNTFFTPNDELNVITIADYKRLFHNQNIPDYYFQSQKRDFTNYGEKNFYSLLTFRNEANRVITTANLNLLQHGFSRRGWIQAKKDMYKGNGRIRHERLNIQVGPLMNIQVHSYQSKEIKERLDHESESLPGGLEHFDIDIYRNVDLIGGKPFERIHLKDLYTDYEKGKISGYNEYAREEFLTSFLNNDSNIGDLKDQKLGMELLYHATISLRDYYLNRNKIQKFRMEEENEGISKLPCRGRSIIEKGGQSLFGEASR